MRLYSPVDLTGNVNMIEKLVLGGTGTGDLPRSSARRANLCAIKSRLHLYNINLRFAWILFLLSIYYKIIY